MFREAGRDENSKLKWIFLITNYSRSGHIGTVSFTLERSTAKLSG